MAVSTVIFFGLLLFCISDVHVDASLSALAKQVRLMTEEINALKVQAVNYDTRLNYRFHDLESSLKEKITESVIPPLIKPLVKHAIADILNDDYIGNIISGHILNEVQSLKTNLQDTKTQLVAVTEDLRRVERERGIYRKSLRKLRRRLTKDIQAVQLHLNQTDADAKMLKSELRQTKKNLSDTHISCGIKKYVKPREGNESSLASSSLSSLTASTTSYPETTAATPSAATGRDLFDASERGDLETVRRIVAAGRVDVNYRGRWNMTPVMAAAYRGHRDVVEFLVDEGADLCLVDEWGNNVLHFACDGGDLETVKLILSLNAVDVNARNGGGQTAAFLARNRQRVLHLLLSRGGTLSSG